MSTLLLVCSVIVVSACSHSQAPPGASPSPGSAAKADSLIVGLEDVRRITGVQTLNSTPGGIENQPRRPNSEPPGACRVFDPTVAFGSDWTQFRSAIYNGIANPGTPDASPPAPGSPRAVIPPKPLLVIQTVGVYPEEHAARNAFERLVPGLRACSELHAKYYDFTVNQADSSTVTLTYTSGSTDIYRIKSSTMVYVAIGGFSQPQQIAETLVKTITDRA